jgi:hypothetical protein
LRFDEIVARVQADLQRGVETVERARLDREGETRVFLTVGSVDVDLPVAATESDPEEAGDDIEVTPGSGDGRVSLSFVPSKVGPLAAAPDFPLDYLEGIGEQRTQDLAAAGIEGVRDLAVADPRVLSLETPLSESQARRFVEMARLVKLGADTQTAEAFVDLGLDRDALATLSQTDVVERVQSAVDAGEVSFPKDYRFDAGAVEPLVSRAELTGLVSGRIDPERLGGSVGRLTDLGDTDTDVDVDADTDEA